MIPLFSVVVAKLDGLFIRILSAGLDRGILNLNLSDGELEPFVWAPFSEARLASLSEGLFVFLVELCNSESSGL